MRASIRASTASVLALVPCALARRRACSGFALTKGNFAPSHLGGIVIRPASRVSEHALPGNGGFKTIRAIVVLPSHSAKARNPAAELSKCCTIFRSEHVQMRLRNVHADAMICHLRHFLCLSHAYPLRPFGEDGDGSNFAAIHQDPAACDPTAATAHHEWCGAWLLGYPRSRVQDKTSCGADGGCGQMG